MTRRLGPAAPRFDVAGALDNLSRRLMSSTPRRSARMKERYLSCVLKQPSTNAG